MGRVISVLVTAIDLPIPLLAPVMTATGCLLRTLVPVM